MKNLYFLLIVLLSFGCSNTTKDEVNTTPPIISTTAELEKLNKKLATDSTNTTLLYARANYYLGVRDFNAALYDMSRVMRLDSMKPEYYITLSDIYFYANRTSYSKGALEKCLRLDSTNTTAMLKLAELYFYVKKHQESIDYINKALRINQNLAKGYFLKGMNYKENGDTAKAISSMITATEQDPEYYSAYMELGTLHAFKKNKIALNFYDNALRLNNKSLEAMYGKAKFFQDAGNWDESIPLYDSLLKIDNRYKFAHFNIGAINMAIKKDYKKAITNFTNAITIDANYIEAYYARGECYIKLNNKQEAKSNFQTALEINPQYELAINALNKMK